MKLRDHRPDDFDELWGIDQQCFTRGIAYSREELRGYIRHSRAFTLVMEAPEGAIAAFLVAESDPAGIGRIVTIDVLPAWQRKQLGSKLLGAAEQRLQESGCGSVLLEVAVDNHSALAFYKRQGYAVLETIPRYYADSVDALVMGKRLGKARRNQ